MVATVFISLIPFTEGLRLVTGKAFARANVPLHLVMTTGETAASAAAASARLAGPWRRTMYELYDWVSPVGMQSEGNVQDEQVERATLEQQPCLGVVLSSVAEGAAWPRDDFLTGATLEFSFGPPPLGPLARPAPNHLNVALAFVLFTPAATGRHPHPPQVRLFARHWNWTRSLTRTRAWGTRYGALLWCSPSSSAALQGSPCSVEQAPPRAVREAAPASRACWRSELGSACLGGTLRREAHRARTHRSSASLSSLAPWPWPKPWAWPWGPCLLSPRLWPSDPGPGSGQAWRASSHSPTHARSSSSSWPGPSTRRSARRTMLRPRAAAPSRQSR